MANMESLLARIERLELEMSTHDSGSIKQTNKEYLEYIIGEIFSDNKPEWKTDTEVIVLCDNDDAPESDKVKIEQCTISVTDDNIRVKKAENIELIMNREQIREFLKKCRECMVYG